MSKIYKVNVENSYSGNKRQVLVMAEEPEVAVLGAGVSPDEVAQAEPVSALDLGLTGLRVKKSPGARDLANFYDGIVECLGIGTGMIESLGIVSLQQSSPMFRGVIGEMIRDIRSGQTVSEAMAEHPVVFNEATVAIMRAGESSGNMKGVIAALAKYEDRNARIQGKLKGGLTYPAIVAVMAFICVMFVSIKLIPAITEQYKSFNAELPLITRMVMAFSDMVRYQPLFWVVLIVGGFYFWTKRQQIARSPRLGHMMLHFPLIGHLYRKMLLARVFRVLSMLLSGGARIGRAFEITALTTGSEEMRKALLDTGERVIAGNELHVAFAYNQHIFGREASKTLAFLRLASHTGSAGTILAKIADATEADVEAQSETVNKLIEPLMLAALSVVVGGIIFAVYFPLFNLGQVVFKQSGLH